MNMHKQNNKLRSHFLKNLFENPLMFLYSNEFAFQFQRNVSVTQLKFLIDAMKATQQSCLESERSERVSLAKVVSSKNCLNLTSNRLTLSGKSQEHKNYGNC